MWSVVILPSRTLLGVTWHRQAAAALIATGLSIALLLVVPASPIALSEDAQPARRVEAEARTTAPDVPPTTSAPVLDVPESMPPLDVTSELVTEPAPTTAPPPAGPHTMMLIGDSMAFTAALGLAPEAGAWDFKVVNEGMNGCGVVRGGPYRYFGAQRDMTARCEAWPAAWEDALARNQPDLVAIVVGRWELMDRVYEGRWTNLFDPAFAFYVESEIERAIALASSGGARVVVFTSPYYRRGIPPGGGLYPEDDPARVDIVNDILRRVAARWQVPVVEVGARLSPGGTYTRDVDGVRVRSDGVHLTRQTGRLLAPWLFPQLQLVMAGPPPSPPAPPAPVATPPPAAA